MYHISDDCAYLICFGLIFGKFNAYVYGSKSVKLGERAFYLSKLQNMFYQGKDLVPVL